MILKISSEPRIQQLLLLSVFYIFIVLTSYITHRNLDFSPDAYYYFQIAKNLSQGNGLTFDGISLTTGFHPLWMLICALIYSVSNNLIEFHAIIVVVLTFLFIGGHYLLSSVAGKLGVSTSTFILASIPIYFANLMLFIHLGVENTLLFFLISFFIWLNYQNLFIGQKKNIFLLVTLVLIYFTRTDSIFLVCLYILWISYVSMKDGNLNTSLIKFSFIAFFILLHWGVMYANFGTIFPTSALAIKEFLSTQTSSSLLESFSPEESIISIRAHALLNIFGVGPSNFPQIRFIGLLTPLSILFSLFIIARKDARSRWPILIVGLTALVQLCYYAIVMNGFMRIWYFTSWFVTVTFASCFFLEDIVLPRLPKIIFYLKFVALLFVLTGILYIGSLKTVVPWQKFSEESQLLKEYKQQDVVLVGFTPDRAAFFSGVSIRHLEGLVNSHEFISHYLKNGQIVTYLKDIGATHFVVSNADTLPKRIECIVKIAVNSDSRLTAFGAYEKHNSYIAIYKVWFSEESSKQNFLDNLCES